MDSAGYIYIVDRKADMIISGGFNIYPHEVEKILLDHEAVEETAVIGVPDELWGESVKALVVIREGVTISEQELIEFCRNNMTSYKKPKTIEFVTSLPRNTYGKINRRALRQPYWKGRDRRV
jgi:long-chain acyl-CoA synthetase